MGGRRQRRALGAVTASFGVARLRDGELGGHQLLRRVDAKLYEAKANGRNRVVVDASDLSRERAGVVNAPAARAQARADEFWQRSRPGLKKLGGHDPKRVARPLGYPFAAFDPPAEAADGQSISAVGPGVRLG